MGRVEDLHQLFQRLVPPEASHNGEGPFAAVEGFVLGLTRARTTVSLYAIPLFLWFSTRLFASVRTALTLVYDARRASGQHFVLSYLAGKARDAVMVVLTLTLVVVNVVLTAGLQVAGARGSELVQEVPGLGFFSSSLGRWVTEIVAFCFSVVLFYFVYRHASPRRLPRGAALAGSLFTATLFEGWMLAESCPEPQATQVKATELFKHLPAKIKRFTLDARREQLATRRRGVINRFGNL